MTEINFSRFSDLQFNNLTKLDIRAHLKTLSCITDYCWKHIKNCLKTRFNELFQRKKLSVCLGFVLYFRLRLNFCCKLIKIEHRKYSYGGNRFKRVNLLLIIITNTFTALLTILLCSRQNERC